MSADTAPWEAAPIDFGQAGVMLAPGTADNPGDRPLTIRPRKGGATPAPNGQPSAIQSGAPSAIDDAPWESAPVDSAPAGDAAAAIGRGLINGVPIVGPALLSGTDRLAAGIRSLKNGTDYGDELKAVQDFDQATADQHPTANAGGQFGGAIASTIPMAAAAPVAFGAEGATVLGRMVLGALTNAGIGGTDAAVRSGGDPGSIAGAATLGAVGGAVGGALGRAAGPAIAPAIANPVAAAADRLGIAVPKAVATDSRALQALGGGLTNIPFAGEPLMQASEQALQQIGQAADRAAGGLGTAGAANAGRGVQSAAQRQIDQAGADQAAYQAAMGQQANAATAGANPLSVGSAVQDRIGQFGQQVADREAQPRQQFSADMGDLAGRLGPADRVQAGQGVTSGVTRYATETLPAQQEAAYDRALSGIPQGARTPLAATRDAAADIMAERTAASLPSTTGGAVGMVADAIRNPHGLTIPGLQTLRRSVGEALRNPTLDTSISRGELNRIYGALSDDLGTAVRTHGGPEAAAAFDAANALTRQGRQAVSAVNRIAQQSPERALDSVVGMAGTGAGGDAARLASIRDMVGDEGFAGVPAAALAKLSTDTAGRLSPAAFARNVGAMTPEGRAALFGMHSSEVQALANRAALLAHAPADAERPLADALGRIATGSPEHVLSRILGLASSGAQADIGQLGQLRGVLGEAAWSRVGGALIRRAAFDPATGAFDPDALVKLAGNLSPPARTMLFGEGAGRQALDAAREMGRQPFNAARAEAEALKRALGQSDEGAFSRIAAMASSGSRADAAQLGRLRSTMTPQEWADVGATVLHQLGRDAAGRFSADRFVSDWGRLSSFGKGTLFPNAELRQSLDDIATVSTRFKEMRRYANPSGTARNTAFHVGALAAAWAEPISTVSTIVGANVITRILASPATAKSMAQWAKAYEVAVTTPTRGTGTALQAASRTFGTAVADHLGVRVPLVSSRTYQCAVQAPTSSRSRTAPVCVSHKAESPNRSHARRIIRDAFLVEPSWRGPAAVPGSGSPPFEGRRRRSREDHGTGAGRDRGRRPPPHARSRLADGEPRRARRPSAERDGNGAKGDRVGRLFRPARVSVSLTRLGVDLWVQPEKEALFSLC